jgi:formate C-acetyltransferase
MLPYYESDKKRGVTREELLESIEEFFIMLNCDSDLYVGMQQGDNGQSMVLGGVTRDGSCAYNELSELSLMASLELKLIDPKINLRVDKNTPLEIYELGTKLTREGLGFPQYNNDDTVIPGLIKWGYDTEDARDYVVAACWEPIIPGKGTDVNNIGAFCLAEAVRECTVRDLCGCKSMNEFTGYVASEIRRQCEKFPEMFANIYMEPAPVH